jgi:hypothetical protein
MRFLLLASICCVLGWGVHPEVRSEDGIVIPLVRIEGTIPKAGDINQPLANIYAKDYVPDYYGPFWGGEFTIVIMKDKVRCVVSASFGGDKKLKEQAEKLVGQRVVVECKADYQIHVNKSVAKNNGINPQPWDDWDVVNSSIKLTLVKIELAK